MKITFVLSSLTLSGGVNVVIEYANRLASRGHEIILVVPNGMVDKKLVETVGVNVKVVTSKVKLSYDTSLFKLIIVSISIVYAIVVSDVIIATHTPTVLPVILASLIFKKGKRTWLFQDYPEMFDHRPVEKYLLKFAPKVFPNIAVVSEACKQNLLVESGINSVLVGEGLSNSDLLFEKYQKGGEKDTIDIMYLGDMRPRKGLQDFLVAGEIVYREFSNIRLVLVSKEFCDIQTNVPHEFFLFPSYEQLVKLYRRSDIFVSTSWAEGLGLPPLEAMATGTPVVLTNSHGVTDYALPEVNCLMVPPRDPKSVAVAIRRLILDETLMSHLMENGPITAQKYNWSEAVSRFEEFLCNKVIKVAKPRG